MGTSDAALDISERYAVVGELDLSKGKNMTDTFTIRIIEPATCVSSLETRSFSDVESGEAAMAQVGEKLVRAGTTEFLIHLIDQTIGDAARTLRRRITEVPTYETY